MNLILGVISSPSKSFEFIVSNKPVSLGFIIWLLFSCLLLSVPMFVLSYSFSSISQLLLIQIKHPPILLKLFGVYLFVFLQNLFAVKYFKFKSKYTELLTCNLFIYIIGILYLVLIILLSKLFSTSSIKYLTIIFCPWAFILEVIAIKKVYETSTGTALKILIFGLLVSFLLSKLVGII